MTGITDSTMAGAPPAQPSFWEDVIDIFVHPVDVYRRRKEKSVWPPMLFVAVLVGVIGFATFDMLSPVFEAEFTRNTAKAIAENPQMAERMAKMRDTSMVITRYTLGVMILVPMFTVGVVTWLVSQLFGAKTTFHQGLVVAAWAYLPRVLSSVAGGVQGLLMDTSNFTSAQQLSLSPARFLDVETVNPILLQLLGRLDITILWETALLAVGVYVTGRITKRQAVWFAATIWLIGSLPAIRQGYMLL
jgi:hypothetical protein